MAAFSLLPHESFSVTVRLKTGLPGALSRVDGEVAEPLELYRAAGGELGQFRFEPAGHDLQRIRIELGQEVNSVGAGLFDAEQPVIEPDFCRNRFGSGNPVDRSLDLAAVRRAAAAGGRIEAAFQLDHVARRIGDDLFALDEVAVTETDLFAGSEAEIALGRFHHEVALFNIKFAGEGQLAAARRRVFRIVDRVERAPLPPPGNW